MVKVQRAKRSKRLGRGMRRRGRVQYKGKLANSEFASAKQTLQLNNDNVNVLYTLYDMQLNQFDRLKQIARAYQYYRITKIELKLKPFADTFTNAGGNSVPYLFWLIDRNESFNFSGSAFQDLRDSGAKPIRFDEKTVNIRWKPSVLQTIPNDQFNPPLTQTFMNSRVSPWLPTNRYAGAEVAINQWDCSIVPHRGLVYGVQQDLSTTPWQYGTEITMHVQFKKPGIQATEIPPGVEVVKATPKDMTAKSVTVPEVPPAVPEVPL